MGFEQKLCLLNFFGDGFAHSVEDTEIDHLSHVVFEMCPAAGLHILEDRKGFSIAGSLEKDQGGQGALPVGEVGTKGFPDPVFFSEKIGEPE